ncbi:hypothetical protein [Haladaptatus pallidirubidus]
MRIESNRPSGIATRTGHPPNGDTIGGVCDQDDIKESVPFCE